MVETNGEVITVGRRTDLALEEKELWEESAESTTELPGVMAREQEQQGIPVTTVQILDQRGEEALHKPKGTYLTLELTALHRRERDGFRRAAEVLGGQLAELMNLADGDAVLVAGLGNRAVTPDAVGPKVLDHLLVTRHLVTQMPDYFSDYRPVSAIAPGVLGVTGLESAEILSGVVERVHPSCLIVVDALASRSLNRICTTVQLADTGLTPGSGIRNSRDAFNEKRFGIPVYAVGVPTVVDVGTLLQDYGGEECDRNRQEAICGGQQMIVTPRDIDAQVDQMAKLVAYGVNLAVQPGMDVDDIAYFVE